MKDWLRRWLGIKEIDHNELKHIIKYVIDSEGIVRRLEDRVTENLRWRELDYIKKEVTRESNDHINDFVNGEEFIDKIIQRIKNKQLS